MDDIKEFENIIEIIIKKHGETILDNPDQMNNLLSDYSKGKYKKEKNAFIQALKDNYKKKLQKNHTNLLNIKLQQEAEHFCNESGYDKKLSLWVISILAKSIGLQDENEHKKLMNNIDKNEPDSPQNNIASHQSNDNVKLIDFLKNFFNNEQNSQQQNSNVVKQFHDNVVVKDFLEKLFKEIKKYKNNPVDIENLIQLLKKEVKQPDKNRNSLNIEEVFKTFSIDTEKNKLNKTPINTAHSYHEKDRFKERAEINLGFLDYFKDLFESKI